MTLYHIIQGSLICIIHIGKGSKMTKPVKKVKLQIIIGGKHKLGVCGKTSTKILVNINYRGKDNL